MTAEIVKYGGAEEIEKAPSKAAMFVVEKEEDKAPIVAQVEAWRQQKKAVEAFFAPRKAASRAVWQRDVDDEKKLLEPLDLAITLGNKPILAFDAKVKAEAEEAKRRQEEADRKLEEERQAALRKAAELEKKGKPEEAQAVRSEADQREIQAEMKKPAAAPVFTRTKGTRTTWSANVVDLKALCRAVADGKVPEDYVEPNLSVLRPIAVKRKTKDLGIPGVEGKSEDSR